MSFDLTQKVKVVNKHANIDELYGLYNSKSEALTSVVPALREKGRTVGIIENGSVVEYWFKDGVNDSNLVLKQVSSVNQDNKVRVVIVTLSNLGLQPDATELQVQTALSSYINGIVIKEDEIYYFQVDGFKATTTVSGGIQDIIAGDNIEIDKTDPKNPIISSTAGGGTSNPVSATQPGIVNNEKLQELGGVDKTVNGIRIGRGAGATANNTAFGSSAAASNDTGTNNTALGSFVLNKNIAGKYNTGVGSLALRDNLGSNNTGVGNSSLKVNTTGSNNAAFGDYALFQNTTGTWNTALGSAALQSNTTGQRNVALASALYWNTEGSFNSGLGINAGYGNTTGSYNTYAGYSSGYNVGTGSYNVAYGYKTLVTSAEGIPASTLNANRNVFLGSSIKFVDGMNDTLAIDNKGATFTDAKDALIYGGFSLANRFVKINGQLSVNPTNLPSADSTFTKHIVAKPDGTFGWEDKSSGTLTLEQVRQNGNLIIGDIKFGYSENDADYGYIGMDSDTDRPSIFNHSKLTTVSYDGFKIKRSEEDTPVGMNTDYDKGFVGSYEFDKQGDRKAFAQLSDVEDAVGAISLNKVLVNSNNETDETLYVTDRTNKAKFLFVAYPDIFETGSTNTKGGQFTVYKEASGYLNIYTGGQTRDVNGDLNQITYYGFQAGYAHTIDNSPVPTTGTYFGRSAGRHVVGTGNTMLGFESGYNIVNGNNNTVIGSYRFPANTTISNEIVISDGSINRIGFRVSSTGLTTIPQQTQAQFDTDTTNKAIVTKEILNNNNKYSLTETKTGGTWIDGKPIYRKVIPYILTENFQGEFLVEHNLKIENYLKIMFISSEHTGKLKLFELSDIPVSNNVSTQNTPFTIVSPDYNLGEDILQVEEILAGSGSTIAFNIILEYTKTTSE